MRPKALLRLKYTMISKLGRPNFTKNSHVNGAIDLTLVFF